MGNWPAFEEVADDDGVRQCAMATGRFAGSRVR